MGPPAIEKHYSPAEVAERLSVDERTIRRWIADGKLASFKVGGHLIRIPESSVHDLLVEQRTVTADDLALERIKKVLTDTGKDHAE